MTSINEEFIAAAFKDGRLTLSLLYKLFSRSPMQLQCIRFRFINGYSYEEIGRMRNCFPSAARSNVKYGMVKLLEYLDKIKKEDIKKNEQTIN